MIMFTFTGMMKSTRNISTLIVFTVLEIAEVHIVYYTKCNRSILCQQFSWNIGDKYFTKSKIILDFFWKCFFRVHPFSIERGSFKRYAENRSSEKWSLGKKPPEKWSPEKKSPRKKIPTKKCHRKNGFWRKLKNNKHS